MQEKSSLSIHTITDFLVHNYSYKFPNYSFLLQPVLSFRLAICHTVLNFFSDYKTHVATCIHIRADIHVNKSNTSDFNLLLTTAISSYIQVLLHLSDSLPITKTKSSTEQISIDHFRVAIALNLIMKVRLKAKFLLRKLVFIQMQAKLIFI